MAPLENPDLEVIAGNAGSLRVALLMDVRSPWSVDIALSLASLGSTLVVIATRKPTSREETASTRLFDEGSNRLARADVQIEWVAGSPLTAVNTARMAEKLRGLGNAGRLDFALALYGGSFAAAAYLSRFRPYGVWWVGTDVRLVKEPIRTISALAARRATLNLANGVRLAEAGRQRFGVQDILPLYIGTDLEPLIRHRRSTCSRPPTVLCARWFEPIYDNLSLVRAFAEVLHGNRDARCIFTSTGSQLSEARKLWTALRPDADANAMRFLGGVSRDAMLENLRSADIYVSMSHSDGTSTSLLEALAAGLYPIISDIPANREWLVDHGCEGLLVPVGDRVALAKSILEVAAEQDLRQRASAHNRTIVARLADSSHNHQRLLQIIRSHVRNPGRPGHRNGLKHVR